MNNFLSHPFLYIFWEFLEECLEWISSHQCTSWGWGRSSRFGMNQKHILPCPKFLVFSISYLPQSFSLLPTSLLPPFHLSPPSYLPPTYLPPPTSPLLPTSPHFVFTPLLKLESTWSGSHHHQSSGVLEAGPTIVRAHEHLKEDPPSSKLGSAWSKTQN